MEPNSNYKNPRFIFGLVGIVLIAVIVVVSILRDRIVNAPYQQVTVMGEGRVSYEPDTAVVNLGIQVNKSPTADAALQSVNNQITRIIEALVVLGIPAEDMQTQNLSLYPEYDYIDGRSLQAGFTANQQMAIKIKNLGENNTLVSQVIDAASKAGANQINGVTFESSNLSELRQEARLKAIADARAKSSALADASGVTLKKIIGWYENTLSPAPYPDPYYSEKSAFGGGSAQVPSGLQEVVVEVSLNYSIR